MDTKTIVFKDEAYKFKIFDSTANLVGEFKNRQFYYQFNEHIFKH